MDKKLKSLSEHNGIQWSTQSQIFDNKPKKNGIACPKCGEELWDSNPMVTLTSHPAQKNIHCDCGYSGYRLAQRMKENKALDVVVGTLGFIVGGMLALWILIELITLR